MWGWAREMDPSRVFQAAGRSRCSLLLFFRPSHCSDWEDLCVPLKSPIQVLLKSVPLKAFQYAFMLEAPNQYPRPNSDLLSKIIDTFVREGPSTQKLA